MYVMKSELFLYVWFCILVQYTIVRNLINHVLYMLSIRFLQ